MTGDRDTPEIVWTKDRGYDYSWSGRSRVSRAVVFTIGVTVGNNGNLFRLFERRGGKWHCRPEFFKSLDAAKAAAEALR